MSLRYPTILALLITLSLSTSAAAHHSRASLTEIEWNPKSRRFEVAMRLRISDLEDAVSAQQKTRFRIDGTPHRDRLIQAYLVRHFSTLFAGHTTCRLHWVGCEPELHDIWLYFEAQSISDDQAPTPEKTDPPATRNHVDRWQDLFSSPAGRVTSNGQADTGRAVVVRHSALMEIQAEQTNIITLTRGSNVTSVILSPSHKVHTFARP